MATLPAWFAACRFIHFAVLIQLSGIFLFSERQAQPALQRACRRTLAGLALVGLLSGGALLAGLMGQGWPDTLRPDVWRAVLRTTFGQVWFWHMLLVLATCAAPLGTMTPYWRYPLLLVLSTAALLSLVFAGHDGLRDAALTALMAYSRSGHLWVALVILTGVFNTLLVLGHWPVALGQPYSRMLFVKIIAVAVMVLLALTNRYRVVPTMRVDENRTIKRLTLFDVNGNRLWHAGAVIGQRIRDA